MFVKLIEHIKQDINSELTVLLMSTVLTSKNE